MNYNVFDTFLATETWHTRHPFDEERFFKTLDKIVSHPDFNADQMAEYMKSKVNNPALEEAIEHYQAAAWAIHGYLKATR